MMSRFSLCSGYASLNSAILDSNDWSRSVMRSRRSDCPSFDSICETISLWSGEIILSFCNSSSAWFASAEDSAS